MAMEAPVEEDLEYESDPEDAIVLSAMRRREASDDEGESDGADALPPPVTGADAESDGQGGAAAYDDEEEEEEEEEFDDEEIEEEEVDEEAKPYLENVTSKSDVELEGEGGEKKANEPFAVPMAGAFYMHDDRFRENGRGRHRYKDRFDSKKFVPIEDYPIEII